MSTITMRKVVIWLPWVLLVVVIGCFFIWSQQQLATSDGAKMQKEKSMPLVDIKEGAISSYNEAVRKAAPAVVNIYTTQKVDPAHNLLMSDPIFREFFGDYLTPERPDENRLGSGVIVREDGYILTNHHVIKNADEIVVALRDGRQEKAQVIGADPESDLAVIKINLTKLPVLPFKLSGNRVGDVVLAIGNPFGIGQTVTQGIISATERMGIGLNAYENFIQTDAAINPGNSGGALIDVYGNLLGINTAIFSKTGGSMGVGFAIPATTAKQVLDSIFQHGRVVRGWLGVVMKSTSDNHQLLPLNSEETLVILNLEPNGPAEQAGLKIGDQILTINDEKMKSIAAMMNYIALQAPNSEVIVQVKRGEEQLSFKVIVGDRYVKTQALAANRGVSRYE